MKKEDLVFLLVDDNPVMLKMMVPMLEDLGYRNFVLARDGIEAWRELKRGEKQIHVVISDLLMPRVDGLELLNRIRNSNEYWDMPFVMVTGDDQQNSLMSSVEVDVNAYIIKPFTPDKLEKEISLVLAEKYNPSEFMRLLQEGRQFLVADNDMEAAQQCFEKAKALKPLEAEPYYLVGILYERQEMYEKAKTEFQKCIELREGHVKAYDMLALVHHRQNNFVEEKRVLEAITELSPDNPERNINLGLACANTGDHEATKKYLKKAGRLTKKHNVPMFEKIFLAYLQGDDHASDAEGVYRKYIDPNMENPRLLNKFAMILKRHGAYDSAMFFMERIVKIWTSVKDHNIPEEDMAVFYFNLAAIYTERVSTSSSEEVKQSAYTVAEKLVNKAIDCNPEHAEARKLYAWLDDHLK